MPACAIVKTDEDLGSGVGMMLLPSLHRVLSWIKCRVSIQRGGGARGGGIFIGSLWLELRCFNLRYSHCLQRNASIVPLLIGVVFSFVLLLFFLFYIKRLADFPQSSTVNIKYLGYFNFPVLLAPVLFWLPHNFQAFAIEPPPSPFLCFADALF